VTLHNKLFFSARIC